MSKLDEIRERYPQYKNVSDEKLANAVYNKFYSDRPRDQFNAAMGLKVETPSTTPQPIKETPRTGFDNLRDFAGGLAGGIQNLADVVGLGFKDKVDLEKTISSKNPSPFLQMAGKYLPPIALGRLSIPRQMAANGLWSAAQASPNEENLLGILPDGRTGAGVEGALIAGGLGAPIKEILTGFKGTRNLSNYLKADKAATGYLQKLGIGTKEDNLRALAKDIQSAHKEKLTKALSYKKPVYEAEGKSNIVNKFEDSNFYKSLKGNEKVITGDAKSLYNKFNESPTLENADALQSELGAQIGDIRRRAKSLVGISGAEKNELQNLSSYRKELKKDMQDYLANKNPDLARENLKYFKEYRRNVQPYREEKFTNTITSEPKMIRKLRGKDKNLPYNVTSKDAKSFFEEPSRAARQIARDIGEKGRTKILYNSFADELQPTARGLAEAILKAKQSKGFSEYVTPEMEKFANQLLRRAKWRDRAKYSSYGLAAAVGGNALYRTIGDLYSGDKDK